jgi:GH25 family lysozyme M1 (1,4-beta-N-acetylmuramidase)
MVLYSYKPFFDLYLLPSNILADSKLWLAQYTSTVSLPKGWNEYSVWQYSNKGVIDGINGNVDVNTAEQ